jgi:hypothetical protein
MTKRDWISYNFAILRAVPHVHTGAFSPVGVVLHARTEQFLGARIIVDAAALQSRARDADVEMLSKYLMSCQSIADGDMTAGPIALAPPSERFHWLTAPRSDVIQCGPVHEGLCDDPAKELERLFIELVHTG